MLAADSVVHLLTYCDLDYASYPMGRKLTTGYVVQLGHSLISWLVKKQDIVSRSSANTEYRAMAMTCCEITWLLALFIDLGFTKDHLLHVDLYCDNQVALYIARKPMFHECAKHITVDCHYI